jgi:predicted nuclease of predicted toxin-antitoxin system
VKLLFDQNLSPKLVKRLADLYPNSKHVYEVGVDRDSDEELRNYARREDLVIVTKDSDFSDLCILLGFPPKVIGFVGEIAVLTPSKKSFVTMSRK